MAHESERNGISKLAQHVGNPISNLVELWDEQESAPSEEAKLLKVVDRPLSFLHNMASEGKAWAENGIAKFKVLKMHSFIAEYDTGIHQWFIDQVDLAVSKGWLRDA